MHYNEFIDINKPIGKNKKHSIIHYVSKYDNCAMMEELIYKYNADVNLISVDGWTPLHISAYKGNIKMINLLINYKKTNFDLILPKLGTALHCACINNNFKIVALLLHKCNPNIKNDDGLLPIDLTIDINIKKLISKTLNIFCDFEENINDVSINRKIKSDGGFGERLTKGQLIEFQFLKNLSFIPPNPARFTGYVYKKGKYFSHYNLRYIEINAVKNLFLRFLSKDDYPGKPKEALSLRKIINCRKKETSEEGKYYMEINFKECIHIYRFDSLKTCNSWIEEINKSLEYIKFWIKYEKIYSDVQAFLCTIKQDIYEIDYLSGDVKNLEIKKESTKKLKPIIIDKNGQNKNNTNAIKDKNLLILENS
jgi:serum/glucocorticoid-regulated kinase 2